MASAEKEKKASVSKAAPLQPLPRLRSLVVTELRGFAEKNPVDFNVFGRVFALTSAVLLIIYAASAMVTAQKNAMAQMRETKTLAAKSVIHEKPGEGLNKPQMPAAQGATAMPSELTERHKAAIANNDHFGKEPLGPAPIEALEEPTGSGSIPRISDDGRKPWYAYSRPYDRSDPRPRIAVVVGELGLARIISETSVSDLPAPVTLAFSAQSPAADAWMLRARNLGHETVLSLPMEPLDYPSSDPGAGTLLIRNSTKQNIKLLYNHMQRGKGYIGLASFSGSRMSTSPEKLRPLLEDVAARGLMWLDTRLTALSSAHALAGELGVPAARADFYITENMGRAAIEAVLKDAETAARQNGKTVLLAGINPLVLSELKEWCAGLAGKNISLAPLTAVTE